MLVLAIFVILVPQGSSDRLVQITGTDAANVGHAKHLMEDTIRRNQSPLPESMAALTADPEPPKVMSGGDNNEYKFTVKVVIFYDFEKEIFFFSILTIFQFSDF